jgi:predicted  nucleic acid-binding Zn ribbon protein
MFVVQVDFRSADRAPDVDVVECLLAAWTRNGQLAAWPSALLELDGCIRATGIVPERDALDDAFAEPSVRAELDRLRDAGTEVRREVLGAHADGVPACACPARTELVLFTTFLTEASPVRCLACFGQVPLYRLSGTVEADRQALRGWAEDYRACDTLQMGCDVGERFGLQQLGDVKSPLARLGRGLAAALESKTGAAVYTCLHDGRLGPSKRPAERPCPACGGTWALERPLQDLFDFRCDPCRLLANRRG